MIVLAAVVRKKSTDGKKIWSPSGLHHYEGLIITENSTVNNVIQHCFSEFMFAHNEKF